MLPEERVSLTRQLALLHLYYHRTAAPDVLLAMYAEDLADLPFAAVATALLAMRRDPKRRVMPLPADVRGRVNPSANLEPVDRANEIAGAVLGAISNCGYINPEKARARIGNVGWRVVERMGGWRHICGTLDAGHTQTFYAQVRDLARSLILSGGFQEPTDFPMLPEAPRKALTG